MAVVFEQIYTILTNFLRLVSASGPEGHEVFRRYRFRDQD